MAKAKADKALVARRIDDILRIRLDGAEWWDTCVFVREKEKEAGSAWFLAEGEKPLSDSQIRRYQTKADALLTQSHERSRKKLFRRHLAQRRNLYARASTTGDTRTALACLRDEAELLGLYDHHAVKVLVKPVEMDREKCRERSLAFWDAVVQSGAPLRERMRAQERIDYLMGLEPPKKLEHSGSGGGSIVITSIEAVRPPSTADYADNRPGDDRP